MRYRSTRGGVSDVSFVDAVLMGLAPDHGLLVPESIPRVDAATLARWSTLAFDELSFEVISLYVDRAEISCVELRALTQRAYSTFRDAGVTPVVPLGDDDMHLLELFHGPTFAFKDVALQFLGQLFELILAQKRKEDPSTKITIVGATSGDTGSSAIEGMRGREAVECFILYPLGRTSAIQEAQMVTVVDENVHAIAVQDSEFDDCQRIVKGLFGDQEFRKRNSLGAVNSINWARIVAQIVYYFYASFRLAEKDAHAPAPAFSVPTGNFGDVLAGWYAKQMGCPCRALLVATNENDILARFFATGTYDRPSGGAKETLAPSMDICISSNFERFVFHCGGNDAAQLKQLMTDFETAGKFASTPALFAAAKAEMHAQSVDEAGILATIKKWHAQTGYVLDPHTAVGVAAAESRRASLGKGPVVCLACAHHAKFPDAVVAAIGAEKHALTEQVPLLTDLLKLPHRKTVLPNDSATISKFIEDTMRDRATAQKHKTTV